MREEPKKLVEQGSILRSKCDSRKWRVNYVSLVDNPGRGDYYWEYELELMLDRIPIVHIFRDTEIVDKFYTGVDRYETR